MLNLRFSRATFVSHSLLLIAVPTLSFDQPKLFTSSEVANADTLEEKKIPLNKEATQFTKTYLQKNTQSLSRIKQKSASTFAMMETVLQKYGIPGELKYLAVVESELKNTAVSRVGAKGPWQFMPATARILGLKVSKKYDERTNYQKSTRAAAVYLRDLYAEYGDWLLVVAAYNCGPGPVNAAIKKAKSRNFWKLQYFLPAESRGHVKKFIATHYYFEGQGGVTTLTKAENLKYSKLLIAKKDVVPVVMSEAINAVPVAVVQK